MVTSTDVERENKLLHGFLAGDAVAQLEFYELMMPRISRTAQRIAEDIPEDIREEIVQQTFVNLLSTAVAEFNPDRGTAWQFIIGKIFNAEQHVRASYKYPVRRKKKNPEGEGDSAEAESLPKIISIDANETIEIPTVNPALIYERQLYVETLINNAPNPLDKALRLIYSQDKSKGEAAELSGLSRFQLHRQIADYRSQLMAA